jgi:hypothetical protein
MAGRPPDRAARDGIAVVVVAHAPRPGRSKARLEPLLGPDHCARLQAFLLTRAVRWALAAAAPGAAYLAFAPADAHAEIAALAPPGIELFAQVDGDLGTRLAAAFAEASARSGRPVVLIGTDVPALDEHHAWAAADDLADGVDVTLGAATDGGYYLIGARRPHPALFAIDADAWGGERVLGLTLESVVASGLAVGWLRSERHLDTPADVAALLADPRTPVDVRAALEPRERRA